MRALYRIKTPIKVGPTKNAFYMEGLFLAEVAKVEFMVDEGTQLELNRVGVKGVGAISKEEVQLVSKNLLVIYIVSRLKLCFGFNPTECIVVGTGKPFLEVYKYIH